MGFRYLPMTEEDKKAMLDEIGIDSTDELFSDIPESIRFKRDYDLKEVTSEFELKKELTGLANKNKKLTEYTSFLGAGAYEHFVPSVVDHVISRSEFYTAYTPYQAEVSQGELQAIFEFQTMICELTGMDVANSSMYDGGNSIAEAVNVSAATTRKDKILVSKAIHPEYRDIIKVYGKALDLEIVELDQKDGLTDLDQLAQELDEDTASVVLQYPNFFGQIEPLAEVNELIKKQKRTMFIVSSNPLALGYLTPPGEFGADIVVGDTQPFGIPVQFGGPHCGYFATTKKLMRRIPGRLVGETVDTDGKRGYVLTLQAREQHIRREKATSNICSNQALNALASSVAMTYFGKNGVRQMAELNMQKARYLKQELKNAGLEVLYSDAFFNEIVIKGNQAVKDVNDQLIEKGFIGGFDLGKYYPELENHMLVAVTEIRTKEEIDTFVKELRDIYG